MGRADPPRRRHVPGPLLVGVAGRLLLRPEPRAADFAQRIEPYLAEAGVIGPEPTEAERELIVRAAPLIQERIGLLGEAPGMLGFLFVGEEGVAYEEDALGSLPANAGEVLAASVGALELIPESEFTTEAVQTALAAALIEGLELKPRIAYGPLRVALSGRRVSPPLFESLELLGRERSLSRLLAATTATTD